MIKGIELKSPLDCFIKLPPYRKNILFLCLIIMSQIFLCSNTEMKKTLETSSETSNIYLEVKMKTVQPSQAPPKSGKPPKPGKGASGKPPISGAKPLPASGSTPLQKPKKTPTMDENKKQLQRLEKTIKEQAKFFDDIKKLIGKVDKMSDRMLEAEEKNFQILKSLEKVKETYKRLEYKITATSLQTDDKLNQINKKVVRQIKNGLNLQIFNLQKEIQSVEEEIKKLDYQIKVIKSKLPNSESECSMYSSCYACSTNPKCGWCSMTQQCVEGNEKGAKDGSCTFFEYKSCSGPRDCESYKNCKDCTRDVSCGWCNKPGSPICMSKETADKGKCQEDKFIHLWKELNVCPHVNIDNFSSKLLISLKNVDTEEPIKKKKINPLDVDIEVKKRLTRELNTYEKEKIKKQSEVVKLLSVMNRTETELKTLENDELSFNLADAKKDRHSKNNIEI
jgi:hypothetical protein